MKGLSGVMKTEKMESRSGGLGKIFNFFKRNSFSGLNFNVKKTVYFLFLAFSAAISSAAQEDNLVARKDFDTSAVWSPKVIMGRDFWVTMGVTRYDKSRKGPLGNSLYFPVSELPEEMRKELDIPAFTEIAFYTNPIDRERMRKNSDGTLTWVPPDTYKEYIPVDRPFIVNAVRYMRFFPKSLDLVFTADYKTDHDLYQSWRKEYPNFLAVYSLGEWGNSANTLYLQLEGRWRPQGLLTEKLLEKIKQRYPENLPDRKAYVNQRLKPYFDRAVEVWHDDASAQNALEGMWNINHLAAYWGAGMVTMETSRSFMNWQYQLMFNRGAARQFNIPWGWYAAAHISICKPDGTLTSQGAEPYAWIRSEQGGPDCGASMNSRERVSYMAWLSGANLYQRETANGNYWDSTKTGAERWKPAPEGQMYINFFNFTRKHQDRGVPYTPVALLVANDRGTCRVPGKAFWRYRYLHSDNMLDGFVTTLFPPEPAKQLRQLGVEITLKNSKYGDIFDALTPDFEKSEAFAKALPAYKAAILIGEYSPQPNMVQVLVDYVQDGGTLILNTKHLNLSFPDRFTGVRVNGEFTADNYRFSNLEPDGAEVLYADSQKRPIFTRNKFGRGHVIVGAPHFLTPYYDDSNETVANTALGETLSGKQKFPYIEWLLTRLTAETLPAIVKGDIQYGFNRTSTGWWLYLFNNKGVIKFAQKPQSFDPAATTEVTVDMSKIKPESVTDLVSGENFSGDQLKITIEPGKFRILEIKVGQFDPDYTRYSEE